MSSGFDIVPLITDLKPIGVSEEAGLSKLASLQSGDNTSQTNFAATLKEVGVQMVQSVENAEATSIAGLKGEADTYEVVSSIMEAERSLRMAVAVRDKIISAYLEISRMQI